MSLSAKIGDGLKEAMKAKDQVRLDCLRMLKASIKNKQVEKGRILTDDEIQVIVSSLLRKGKEAAEGFRAGGREDLALKEEAEARILYQFLPGQLTPEEVESIIKEIIVDLSASGPKDLGKVMKTAMAKMAGRAEGKEVSEIVRRLLG